MKREITILLVFYVAVLLIQYGVIFSAFKGDVHHITPMATGEVRLCINHAPIINYSCESKTNTSIEYFCQINAIDYDNQTLNYDVTFIDSTEIFNITQEGIINFTPSTTQTGNYTYLLTVFDSTGCSNYFDTEIIGLEINRAGNSPPYLAYTIPNQTMNQGSTLTSIDLDDYFRDPDNDPLSYTFTYSANFDISLTGNNEVVFTPDAGFYGSETFRFYAWDPYLANGSSNLMTIKVLRTVQASSSSSSSGGGGGGGGGGIYCLPRWYCSPWGECEPDNLMRRECFDSMNCSSNYLKPNITQECTYVSTCYDGIQGIDEEGVDCGGKCPPCGTCYDNICNNNEDCIAGLVSIPDCGGPCRPCNVAKPSCYDNICNNDEDCTRNLTDIPDCGGDCKLCPHPEEPAKIGINWVFWLMIMLSSSLLIYSVKKAWPYFMKLLKKRKIMLYEQRLMLEAKVVESILESLSKLEMLLDTEKIEKLVMMFSDIIRRYFRNLLDLKYEFTYEELISEINQRNLSEGFKKVLEGFFNRTLEIEYSGKNVNREELRAMVSEFKVILTLTSQEPIKTENIQAKKIVTAMDKMYALITEAEQQLRLKNINKSYDNYLKLNKEFPKLTDEEKRKIHGFLLRLYDEIKLARKEMK